MKLKLLISLCFFGVLSSCSVSEDMIANKELYCSEIYKGIRAVGRVATEVTTGIAIVDVCDTIDEIVEEEEADATDKSDSES
tara:strand:- start:210 stop:455 length:246 start_codon:yes stop_codon:yes gene_type:complete